MLALQMNSVSAQATPYGWRGPEHSGNYPDAVVDELVDRGYQKRVEHFYPGGSWTIIDSEQSLGVNLNIKPAM